MNWGLLVIYGFAFVGLLINANQHGKPKEGMNNFWIGLTSTITSLTLIWWALGWRFW